jgi:hypothetical protein
MNLKRVTLIGLTFVSAAASAQQLNAVIVKDIIESTLSGAPTGQDAVKLSFVLVNKDGSPQMERAAHFPFYTGERFKAKLISSQNGALQLTNISPAGKVTPFRVISVQAGVPAYYPPEATNVLEFANIVGDETLRVTFTPAGGPAANAVQTPFASASGQVAVNPAASYVTPANAGANGMGAATSTGAPGSNTMVSQAGVVSGVTSSVGTPPTRASDYFGDVSGKAYVYAKDIREVVLETTQSTMLTRPSGSGSLQFDVKVMHRN